MSARRHTSSTLNAPNSSSDSGAHLSRPTSSPLAGKFDVCTKVMLNDEMSDALRIAAREHGFLSVSDCLREVIAVFLFGEECLIDLHASRIQKLAKNMAKKVSS